MYAGKFFKLKEKAFKFFFYLILIFGIVQF